MRLITFAITALCLLATPALAAPKWAIAIHGGAGVIERKDLTPEVEAQYRAAMTRAAATGSAVLDKGGSSMDAVEAVIRGLELFNAGRGAVFTADGRNELDAAVMDGKTLKAGAVAGVTRTRHPITLARAVMEKSRHVMLIAPGADAFAAAEGIEQVDPSWFFTERRWRGLVKELTKQGLPIPPRPKVLRIAGPLSGARPPGSSAYPPNPHASPTRVPPLSPARVAPSAARRRPRQIGESFHPRRTIQHGGQSAQ